MQVHEIKETLNKNLSKLDDEKQKLKTILDVMKTGVLVLDNDTIVHANQMVINYFELDNKTNLHFFVQTFIKDKLQKTNHSFIQTIHQKDYLFDVVPYHSKWLENGYIISVVDITEELRLEKTKKEFFQNASHELKSPLTIIKGNLELITEGIIVDNINETLIKTIKEIDTLNTLINQMLDVSLLENNASKQSKHLSIKTTIVSILDKYKPKIYEKKLTLNQNLDDSKAYMEKRHLEMLLNNLIDNAIKYNKESGLLDVTLHNQTLTIKDSGIGIKKDEMNRIYERFFRSSSIDVKKTSGSGLGLAIVKHIALTYDIDITLSSDASGTTFKLYFKNEQNKNVD
ncbi:MAG: ATP-binding protein [Acholeplasmataceae bacterium]